MIDNNKLSKVLSKNIKKARENCNMIQDDLAEKSNISTQFLREIEAGKKVGSITTIINICIALNITPNELFYDVFKKKLNENEQLLNNFNSLSQRDKDIIINMLNKMLD